MGEVESLAKLIGDVNIALLVRTYIDYIKEPYKTKHNILLKQRKKLNDYYLDMSEVITNKVELNLFYLYVLSLAKDGETDEVTLLLRDLVKALDSKYFDDLAKMRLCINICNIYLELKDYTSMELYNEKAREYIIKSGDIKSLQSYMLRKIIINKVKDMPYEHDLDLVLNLCKTLGIEPIEQFKQL